MGRLFNDASLENSRLTEFISARSGDALEDHEFKSCTLYSFKSISSNPTADPTAHFVCAGEQVLKKGSDSGHCNFEDFLIFLMMMTWR